MAELIWDGKYDKDGRRAAPLRVALPFQTVETVNESARQRQLSLERFHDGRDPEWRNRLIWGDKKYVLPSLLEEFAGQVDLIYIDPPFATGQNFSFNIKVDSEEFTKEPSIIEQKAYRDTWGQGLESYLGWFYESVVLMRDLLGEHGSIYVHCDTRLNCYLRLILEEVFGSDNCLNEIVWKRSEAHSDSSTYGKVHDVILFFRRGEKYTWNK